MAKRAGQLADLHSPSLVGGCHRQATNPLVIRPDGSVWAASAAARIPNSLWLGFSHHPSYLKTRSTAKKARLSQTGTQYEATPESQPGRHNRTEWDLHPNVCHLWLLLKRSVTQVLSAAVKTLALQSWVFANASWSFATSEFRLRCRNGLSNFSLGCSP